MTSADLFTEQAMPVRPRLFNKAYQLTGRYEDAEDLVQETYTKAFKVFHQYEQGTNLSGWLYVILKNTFINGYRKGQRSVSEIPAEDCMSWVDQVGATPSSEDTWMQDAPGPAMEAFKRLPEEFKQTAYLADIEGYQYREIACIQGIPLGTVMSRLHRARKRMRELVEAAA